MALRATNLATGEYYSRYWKASSLTNLDTDSQGWILVKAKNFSDTKVELFRLSSAVGPWTGTGILSWTQPATYIAFQGGRRFSGLIVGADSNSNYSGWYNMWTGEVNLHNRVYIRRSAIYSVANGDRNSPFPHYYGRGTKHGSLAPDADRYPVMNRTVFLVGKIYTQCVITY